MHILLKRPDVPINQEKQELLRKQRHLQRRAKNRIIRTRCHSKIKGGGRGERLRYSTAILKRNRDQYSSDSFSIF